MELVVLALEKHFGYSRYRSEVAVDLERRMGVEEVGERGLAQEFPVHLVGLVSVKQPCPEADFPCFTPAGTTITSDLEGLDCSFG